MADEYSTGVDHTDENGMCLTNLLKKAEKNKKLYFRI